eukprot:CAMPEP_0174857934 /NCGR_PEP_ID=MMETSP1114-20130205/40727_1 /TAXON_ID=312471 /ORGANISM="Neobodo designis, Strain CCAP 1951/1" /LENGTH=56 /DNA_ID=CAMNT_0016092809 /DNA_START=62 /DNA_END=229 /DNA_ORIENTATION=+
MTGAAAEAGTSVRTFTLQQRSERHRARTDGQQSGPSALVSQRCSDVRVGAQASITA